MWPNGLPPTSRITAVDLAPKVTARQFGDLDRAAEHLCAVPNRYLTIAAMKELARGRGKAGDVVALPCLWHDLDTREGTHAETELPATTGEALEFLAQDSPVPPSIVLSSGGGLYAFWLFDEPWVLTTDGDRRGARALSRTWQQSIINERASARGWTLDDTSDLTRCLRAEGTLNGKYEPPRLVSAIDSRAASSGVRRYSVAELQRIAGVSGRSRVSPATNHDPCGGSARDLTAAMRAAEFLGGPAKIAREGDQTSAVVLTNCPACGGLEAGGGIVTGTAHLTPIRLALRCKRNSCLARGDGLSLEQWTVRFLDDCQRAELSRLVAVARSSGTKLYTDAANADAFIADHGEDVRFCSTLGGWLLWDGRRWSSDADPEIVKRGKATARRLAAEVEKPCGASLRAQSQSGIQSMLELAKAELHVSSHAFNRDRMLLNVANGTLDLRTGDLRRHNPEDRITAGLSVAFDANARCDDLDRFLNRSLGGARSTLEFLERWLGYCLTGETSEQKLLMALGPGSTGKSTLIEMFAALLGDYAKAIPYDALLRQDRRCAGPRPELARLVGCRLATASEVSEGAVFDAATLKSLTGGDRIAVRDMYSRTFDLDVTFKIMLAANCAPRIERAGTAERRRILVLPLQCAISEEEENTSLPQRLRQPDALAALLAMAVRGCAAWLGDGLRSCEAVEQATTSYWSGADASHQEAGVLDRFLTACCELVPSERVSSESLRRALHAFTSRESQPMLSDRRIAAFLREHGCQPFRTPRVRGWSGLRLRTMTA
jgi:putative DNA primase/helicase